MRAPRGFGKNYFTLNAIQAYASAHRLGQETHRIRIRRENRLQIAEEADAIDDPPPELLIPIEPLPTQGGLCNCRFARLSHLCLRRNKRPKKLIVSPIHTYSTLSPPVCTNTYQTYLKHFQIHKENYGQIVTITDRIVRTRRFARSGRICT